MAFVTQGLWLFEIGTVEIMMFVWAFGGMWWGFTLMGVNIIYAITYMFAQRVVKQDVESDSTLDTNAGTAAATMVSAMQSDMLWGAYEESAMIILFIQHMGAWTRGMWQDWDEQKREENMDEGRRDEGDDRREE